MLWREKFREELLELIGKKQGKQHYGEQPRESDQRKAERLIAETLKKVKWTNEDLKLRRKGDAIKASLANRLRSETTVAWPWICLSVNHGPLADGAMRLKERKNDFAKEILL